MRKLLKKERLKQFFEDLTQSYEVIAPVKKKSIHSFEVVESYDEIDLNYINTAYSAKKFFLPVFDEMFSYEGQKIKEHIDKTKRVVFGIRPCDVHALLVIDRIYLDEHEDPYYKARRDNTLIIAINCLEAGDNCFCGSFHTHKLSHGFDLLFTEVEQGYVIETGSDKGKELVNGFSDTDIVPKIELKFKKQITQADVEKLKQNFENPIWEEQAKKCLSCGACTTTCPTCPCFFMLDEQDLDMQSGTRCRYWASCQLKNFTRVAGDAVFRKERSKRLKHRIFHQLVYYKEKFCDDKCDDWSNCPPDCEIRGEVEMCVGCGRCFTNCPTGIDMVDILKRIK